MVNNGASDHTDEVIAGWCDALPLRLVHEPRPGLSIARNLGIREARGEYLCWIDDDVQVPKHYLQAYADAFVEYPATAVFGGPIVPVLSASAPRWLRDGIHYVADAYAARRPALANDIEIRLNRLPYGANFVLQAETARQFPFDEALGRHPDRPVQGGEELDVMRRILRSGQEGRWVRDADVAHHIQPQRESEDWVEQYYYAVGHNVGRWQRNDPLAMRLKRGVNARARMLAHRGVLVWHGAQDERPRRARNVREAAWYAGYLRAMQPCGSGKGGGES